MDFAQMHHREIAVGRAARSARAAALLILGSAMASCGMLAAPEPSQPFFDRDREGRAAYQAEPTADRIPDFSNVGYMGGGVRIPEPPVVEIVRPADGDDGQRIQDAVDRVAMLPLQDNGF